MRKLIPLLFTALSACVVSAPKENISLGEQCTRLVCTDSYGVPLCKSVEKDDGKMWYDKFDYPAVVGVGEQTIGANIKLLIDGKPSTFPPEEYLVVMEPVEARLRQNYNQYEEIPLPVGKLPLLVTARKNNSSIVEIMQYESGDKSVLVTIWSEECGTQTFQFMGSHYQWFASQVWK